MPLETDTFEIGLKGLCKLLSRFFYPPADHRRDFYLPRAPKRFRVQVLLYGRCRGLPGFPELILIPDVIAPRRQPIFLQISIACQSILIWLAPVSPLTCAWRQARLCLHRDLPVISGRIMPGTGLCKQDPPIRQQPLDFPGQLPAGILRQRFSIRYLRRNPRNGTQLGILLPEAVWDRLQKSAAAAVPPSNTPHRPSAALPYTFSVADPC